MTSVRVKPLIVLLGVLGLAGCGAAPAKTKLPVVTGIFLSSKDCTAKLGQPAEQCGKFIDTAIATHLAKAKSYISQRLCEDAEGADRCERHSDKDFKPRLVAFYVSLTAKPVGEPLYLPKNPSQASFTSLDKSKTYKVVDETLVVSDEARQVAGAIIKKKR